MKQARAQASLDELLVLRRRTNDTVLLLASGASGVAPEFDGFAAAVTAVAADLARQLIELSGFRPEVDIEIRFIGLRPGEKLHEIMCPRDDSHLTLDFDDHYVIQPTISFTQPVDYRKNRLGQAGRAVTEDFEYSSGSNTEWLTVEQMQDLIKQA